MALEFGIFDHVDRHDGPLSDFYEDRLKLIEAYDRAGIYGYHCAEHHSTPLGMAPSPSVYLAAIAQRTRRLNFGPLVYTLALYHPLRLAEEICMLDQMSRGRFLLGIGVGHPEAHSEYKKPYDALVEYLDALDAAHVPTSRRVIAALGPKVLKLAATRSAGSRRDAESVRSTSGVV